MKNQLAAVLLAGMFTALPCAAQTSVYDQASGKLDVPCVATFDGSQLAGTYVPYHVRLGRIDSGNRFALEHATPVQYHSDCSGQFDSATGLYTDLVNIGDESYELSLRRGDGNIFTLETLAKRGAATTSVWIARNGANTVYLAGTVHVLRAADYPLPRAYDAAYEQSSALYFEIDMDDPAETGAGLSPAQQQQLLADPQGLTLTQVLTPQIWSALYGYMQGEGLSLTAVDAWSTQMLIHALGYREVEFYNGYSADGVDDYIANRAMRDGKVIHGLETSALHYDVLHSLSEGRENELVQEFLADVGSQALLMEFNALIAAWRQGDLFAINRDSVETLRNRSYSDYLLLQVNRNNAWMPQIEALLQTPATEMVVVGVAHMAGTDGLVAQLRQRGYSVEKY